MSLLRRVGWPGLLAFLLALSVQLGLGASVPHSDAGYGLADDAGFICHSPDQAAGDQPAADQGSPPAPSPVHPSDCLLCPLCATLHAQLMAVLPRVAALDPPAVAAIARPELPPPATAPPSDNRRPNHPRAPPILS